MCYDVEELFLICKPYLETLGRGHYLEQGRGLMILGRGYEFLGSAGGGVMEYPQRKKEGLLEINEHLIHSKEYGFIVLVLH